MSRRNKKVFRLFLAWQDEKEEEWLREMSLKGWEFKRYFFGYNFEKTEPKDVVYRLDYKSTFNNDFDEYLKIYQDAGWEHVAQGIRWNYFRTDVKDCVLPEIYSDNYSKIQKYKGLLRVLLTIFGLSLINFSNIGETPILKSPFTSFYRIASISMLSLLGYCCYRVYKKIKLLKQEI